MRQKTNWKKGSATIEMALLAPLVFTVIFGLLYLTLHVHNSAVLRIRACEAATSGKALETPALIFAESASLTSTEEDGMRTVATQTQTVYFSGQKLWQAGAEVHYKKVHPVRAAYLFHTGEQVWEALTE